jgi:DNA processing protein
MHAADNLHDFCPTRQIMPLVSESEVCFNIGETGYPASLRTLSSPPAALWVRGRVPEGPSIAMVGARAASGVGCARARAMAALLAGKGFAILSGGAFGIDAAAHEGALSVGAPTFAVLGCGVDVIYPDRHGPLFERIAASGGLLSEYAPGIPPRSGQFPARNRIIAALADAVIVVEAAVRSGALITARLGRALGKPVLAIPGSPGTDGLLQKGQARLVASAADVQEVLAGRQPILADPAEPPTGVVATLVAALREGAATPAQLCRKTGLPLPSVMAALAEAELDGWIFRSPGNQFEVTRRGC